MSLIKYAALALVFAIAPLAHLNAQTVRFGSVADFAPYNYLDDEGVMQGFEADLQAQICARADLVCEWVPAPWNELLTQLGQGEFDVIMSAYQITDARKLYVSFTDEYLPADPSAVMVLSGNAYPPAGNIVGAQSGTLQADYVTSKGWALSSYGNPASAIEALRNDEITAFVGDQAYLEGIMAASPGEFTLAASDVVIGGGIGMAVSQSDPALLSTLNTALASLKQDGTLDALIGTWFDGRDPNYRNAAE